jgi:hypothetical protein
VVEAGGRREPAEEGTQNAEEDRGREVGSGTPGGEGDAIRTWGGVIRGADRALNIFEVRGGHGGGVNGLGVGVEEGVSLVVGGWRTLRPDTRPEAEGDGRFVALLSSRGGVSIKPEGGEPGTAAGQGGGEELNGITAAGWTGEIGGSQQVIGGIQEPVVDVDARLKENEAIKRAVKGEEGGDGDEVLRETGNEVEELDVPGN